MMDMNSAHERARRAVIATKHAKRLAELLGATEGVDWDSFIAEAEEACTKLEKRSKPPEGLDASIRKEVDQEIARLEGLLAIYDDHIKDPILSGLIHGSSQVGGLEPDKIVRMKLIAEKRIAAYQDIMED